MSRFTNHAERFEIQHPRAARAMALAILAGVALLAFAADSALRAFGIQ
ncbi:hypothetical protein KDW46_02280 [Burkholderia vietnamiensis]|nr:hypothetical protein [Burkholderia vietnamiensis]